MVFTVGEWKHIGFFDEKLLEIVGKSKDQNFDGTFKAKANLHKVMQLFTMMGRSFGKVKIIFSKSEIEFQKLTIFLKIFIAIDYKTRVLTETFENIVLHSMILILINK